MKADNLCILKKNGINVPDFIVVENESQIDLGFSKSEVFAVRSSYTGEDSDEYSFAGQFETLLNVKRDEVNNAVNRVLDSENINSVNTYKGIVKEQSSEQMKVIVQNMVDSEYSGIIFTANPMGIMNEIVIVVGNGLGNMVVEDKTEVTTYYYNTSDNVYYYEKAGNSPCLSDDIINKLVNQAKSIEKIFNKKMDIEFGIQAKVIFILQARPITTINMSKADIVLDNSNIVESYPGVSLPLTQSFVKEVYYKVFRSCLLRLTKEKKTVMSIDDILKNMVDTANGRIYYRISNWYDVILFLPFSNKIIPIWQEMLGVEDKRVTSSVKGKISCITKLKVTGSFVNLLITNPKKMKWLNNYFDRMLPTYRQRINNAKTAKELEALLADLKEDLSEKWDITLVNDMYTFIYTALAKKKHGADIADISQLESMKPVIAVKKLEKIAKEQGMESKEYIGEEDKYIEIYGDRCLEELKLETHTYRTDRELLRNYIFNNIKNMNDGNDVSDKKCISRRESFAVKRAKIGIKNREISRMNRSRLFGMARDIILKMADIMVNNNQLDDRWDIFYLYYDEVLSKLYSGDNCRELVKDRKDEFLGYKNLPEYSRIVYKDAIFNKSFSDIGCSSNYGNSEILCGNPCSKGIVRGNIIVIDKPSDVIDTNNKIIVTKMTDPGWVLLIHKAAGIIAEKGSLLSHTAIITRELKKPAVVGVKNAVEILKTGDLVEINGETGVIKILERVD